MNSCESRLGTFSLAALDTAIGELLEDLNNRPMRHVGRSRRELFEEIERAAFKPLPTTPFEYAEWNSAKVHPYYHIEFLKTLYSAPHRLIGCTLQVRLTHRVVEIFHDTGVSPAASDGPSAPATSQSTTICPRRISVTPTPRRPGRP